MKLSRNKTGSIFTWKPVLVFTVDAAMKIGFQGQKASNADPEVTEI